MGTERCVLSHHTIVGYADHHSAVTFLMPTLIVGQYSCLGFLSKAEIQAPTWNKTIRNVKVKASTCAHFFPFCPLG